MQFLTLEIMHDNNDKPYETPSRPGSGVFQVDTTFGKGVSRLVAMMLGAAIGFGILYANPIFSSPYYAALVICGTVFLTALLLAGNAQEVNHLFFAG